MNVFGYEIKKAKKQKANENPLGIVGLRTSSGFVEEEFIRDLRWPEAGKIYQEMANNDVIIGACLYLIETIIRKASWSVTPASEETSDIEIAEFIESCMFDMQEQTWDDFICEVLSMLVYGFSFHEVLYKVRRGPDEKDPRFRSAYTDGKIGWQELPVRSQASMSEWTFDEKTGKVLEFVQDPGLVGADGDVANIPIEGNLLFKTKANRDNPEGVSILRKAYRSWYFKRYIEELEGIGIERNLAGIPHLQPDENTPLFDPNNKDMIELLGWAQDLVDGLRQDRDHGIITPNGWSLELLGSKGSTNSIDTDKIIHRHEARMAASMLADIVVMGGDRTGSFALAEVKQSLLVASLQAIVGSICSTLNSKAIPKLLSLNGIVPEKLPTIQAADLEEPSIKEVALLLRSMKINVTSNKRIFNYMLSLMRAPTLNDEEFEALTANLNNSEGEDEEQYQDTVDGDAKQSDLDYM